MRVLVVDDDPRVQLFRAGAAGRHYAHEDAAKVAGDRRASLDGLDTLRSRK